MIDPSLHSTRSPRRLARWRGRLPAFAAVLTLLVAACGPAATTSVLASPGVGPSATTSSSPAGPTGTLTVGLSADAESMDPYRVYQNAGFSVMYAIFDTLVTIAPDGSL